MPSASNAIWDPTNAMVLIQPKGFGHEIFAVDPHTSVDPLAGGEISWESVFQTNKPSGYIRTVQTSNPGRLTGTIKSPLRTKTIPQLRKMMTKLCPGNIYLLTGCSVEDQATVSDYDLAYVLVDAFFTNSPLVSVGALVLGGTAPSVESQDAMTSAGFTVGAGQELIPLIHEDISETSVTGDITDGISLQRERCAGNCGDEIEIEDEYIWITAAPGGAYDDPELWYTPDKGVTRTRNILTGVGAGDGTSVTLSGNNVVFGASGTDAGAYYAALQDVIDGIAVGVEATGVGTNQVNAVKAFGNVVIAVGQGGVVWKSIDGGYSYEVLAAAGAVTAENLTGIAGMNSDLIWVYGDNGALLRIRNLQTPTLVTTGVTDNFTAGDVPNYRSNELWLGTDAGDVYVTFNATANAPSFTTHSFDKPAGGSTIDDLKFAGIKGNTLFLVQTNASSDSRVIVDRSGGYLAQNGVVIGTFAFPVNNGINVIAPATPNFALTFGNIESTYGFIGRVS